MKKFLTLVSVSITTLILVGCATPKYNYVASPQHISKPPIGEISTAYVGDKMLEQGIFTEREALSLPETTKKSGYTLSAGSYLKTGEDKNGSYFLAINQIPNGGMVTKTFIMDPFQAIMLTSENELCVITVLGVKSCTTEHKATLTKVGVASDNSFQQTLIYSGKIGNKINVGYREYSSNLARPAFNNDVEYDLSESKQVGYKGALLEIIEATNQNIKYKVLRNFNKVE